MVVMKTLICREHVRKQDVKSLLNDGDLAVGPPPDLSEDDENIP